MARRELVWKCEGELNPGAVAAALDEHIVAAPGPRFRPLRLAVSLGDHAPDVVFRDDRGTPFALHRLRGRRAVFTFWQSWSAPCVKELRRLQAWHGEGRGRGAFIAAFHGGAEARDFEGLRRQLGLSFPLVQDAEHQVARKYGVRCWPTTITIDADGRVEHIQLGLAPEPHRATGHDGPAAV